MMRGRFCATLRAVRHGLQLCHGFAVDDRYSLSVTRMGIVVPHSVMLCRPIVPEHKHVRRPAHATLKFDMRFNMSPQYFENRGAFFCAELVDPRGEPAIDVERSSAAPRHCYHDRMDAFRPASGWRLGTVTAGVGLGAVM